MALAGELTSSQQALIANYTRDSRIGARANSHSLRRPFGRSADADRPASLFCKRAHELAEKPPGEDWDPIRTLQEK